MIKSLNQIQKFGNENLSDIDTVVLQDTNQQDQVQTPCDYCSDWIGELPDITEIKQATHLATDECFGIPIQMNLCDQHYYELEELKLENTTGGLYN